MVEALDMVVLLVFLSTKWHHPRARRILEHWAQSNGYVILSSKHWEVITGQEVYSVTIRTSEGEIRRGRVRCGSWILGTFLDTAKVRWEE